MSGDALAPERTIDRRNPYVFVVGCPRSGTTLLQRMLDSHPRLAVANDTHFIPKAVKDYPPAVDPALTRDLVQRVRDYRRFSRLGLSDEAVARAAAGAGSYADFVSALYDRFGRLRGKPLAGEKTPDYVKQLPLLHGLFPRARFVHIFRDGRDVALSTLDWSHEGKGPARYDLWRREPVAVCALWWSLQAGSGRRDGSKLGPSVYHEVCYEDLVAEPERSLRAILGFLDLPFAPEVLRFNEGKVRQDPGLSAKHAWLSPTPGLRDWRSEMAVRDVELFEALAGALLSELGYEARAHSTSPKIVRTAANCRARWQSELLRRSERRAARLDRLKGHG